MGRLRRLYALSRTFHLHQPQTSLPKLRKRLLRSMFVQIDTPASPWHPPACPRRRRLLRQTYRQVACYSCTFIHQRPEASEPRSYAGPRSSCGRRFIRRRLETSTRNELGRVKRSFWCWIRVAITDGDSKAGPKGPHTKEGRGR